ncbi:MAG: MATE family efflux transporter [Lachnospiraceae bacterium]|nr:MATE family efflux transporter [Lachnospiraceae bacterium]
MNKDLTVGKPSTVLWKFCIPLLGSVVFQQLYNIADSLVAGRYVGEDALAAVGNSYEITLIYLAFAFGCNMGCSVTVSQFFGAKNYRDMKTAVYTTFIFTAILCGVLMLVGFIFGGELLKLINTPTDIFDDSKLYLDIYTGGLFFLFFYNIATGIFSALGDSKTPFIFLAISSVANVAVDILFVKEFNMDVAGVAWATFICQGVSCVASVIVVLRRLKNIDHNSLGKSEKVPAFSKEILKKFLRIAIPSTLQQSFVSVGNIIIQGIINSFGSAVIAGYSAAIKLNNMVITTFSALGNGMSNFTAQNIGGGKPERIKEGHSAGLRLALLVYVPIVLVYMFFADTLVNLFMDGEQSKALIVGVEFLHIVAPFYIIIATKIISDGVLRGVGAMNQFMIATFSDLILRVGLAFLLSAKWEETGIWLAWPVGWIIGTLVSVVFYISIKKKIETKQEIV